MISLMYIWLGQVTPSVFTVAHMTMPNDTQCNSAIVIQHTKVTLAGGYVWPVTLAKIPLFCEQGLTAEVSRNINQNVT